MEIVYGHTTNEVQNDLKLGCASQLFHYLGKGDVTQTKAVVCCDLFLLYQDIARMKCNHVVHTSYYYQKWSQKELWRDHMLILPTGYDHDSFTITQRLMKLFSITTKMYNSDLEQLLTCNNLNHKTRLDEINLHKEINIRVDCNDKTACFRMECPTIEKIISGAPLLAQQVTPYTKFRQPMTPRLHTYSPFLHVLRSTSLILDNYTP